MDSIELFAGAGGLALGTAQAGIQHRSVFEWDQDACDTLRKNHLLGTPHVRDWKIVQTDVRSFDFSIFRDEVEMVCGGPPCQPFSIGGKHRGHFDDRNMFPHAIRAIREIRPKAFLFENVKGLLRRGFANYFQYILNQLRYPTVVVKGDEEWTTHHARLERIHTKGDSTGLTYQVVPKLVNAVDFGVPQHRWRVFLVGIRSDLGVEFAFPESTHSEDALLYSMWITGDYWDRHKIPKKARPAVPLRQKRRVEALRGMFAEMLPRPWRTVRDAIADLPRLRAGETSRTVNNHFLNPGARSYPGHDGSPFDSPAKTLKAGDHGVPGGENTLRMEDGTVRYFSVRECARLQTFPDRWFFSGAWTESMRQLGNAVPVKLGQVIGESLVKTLSTSTAHEANRH